MMEANIIVHGRVQGVCFRMYAQEEAQKLGITGWVRNRRDQTVEICAQGDPLDIEKFISWCHQGSPYAQVTQVEVEKTKPKKILRNFDIVAST